MPERILAGCAVATVLAGALWVAAIIGSIYGEEVAYQRMAWHCDDFKHFMAGPGQTFSCRRISAAHARAGTTGP